MWIRLPDCDARHSGFVSSVIRLTALFPIRMRHILAQFQYDLDEVSLGGGSLMS